MITYFRLYGEMYGAIKDTGKQKHSRSQGSPFYKNIDEVPKKIYDKLSKDVYFIFMLRNPVDRVYSSFRMQKRTGNETKSFGKALEYEDRIKIHLFPR
jgi:hypothetical protein